MAQRIQKPSDTAPAQEDPISLGGKMDAIIEQFHALRGQLEDRGLVDPTPEPGQSLPVKRPSRSRSEEEMRESVAALSNDQVARQLTSRQFIPPNYDAPVDILEDAINELLSLRQLRADVQAFIQGQQIKLRRG